MAGEWRITHSAEVEKWYASLDDDDRRRAGEVLERLKQSGPELRQPQTKVPQPRRSFMIIEGAEQASGS